MVLEPPCTEAPLKQYHSDSHEEAYCMSAMTEKTESPIVEQHCAEDRLCQIIGETHFSVRSNLHKPVLGSCLVEEKGSA